MGGIADYSGSLVLQMPIAEACHVALQLQQVEEQTLWKHIQVSMRVLTSVHTEVGFE
jgi:L-arabinokinase